MRHRWADGKVPKEAGGLLSTDSKDAGTSPLPPHRPGFLPGMGLVWKRALSSR